MKTAEEISELCKKYDVKQLRTYKGIDRSTTIGCNQCQTKWESFFTGVDMLCPKCSEESRVEKILEDQVEKTSKKSKKSKKNKKVEVYFNEENLTGE